MPTTNDPLEGACGDVRVWKHKAPNMTLATFNTRKMYKQNNTDAYIEKNFGPEHHKFVIKIGRERSNGQAEQKHLIALGQADKQVAVANKAKKKQQQRPEMTPDRRIWRLNWPNWCLSWMFQSWQRKIQPSMTYSSSSLSGTDLLIPAFHPRDKSLNSTRKPSNKH